ncbi:MAG: aminomethyl-transferring glycine dehydrogenase subunit GcvPA [Polyangiales bacterium]|nr:aminomethyl-transferring glycine dehydrogenase subunit GcvPA [Myxococcales bacterium]
MRYLPHTSAEIEEMLTRIGVPSIDALFAPIPEKYRLGRKLDLEPALDEATLMGHLGDLAAKNPSTGMLSFLGAGMYDHHIPPAVDQLLLRSEFYTAYTPYQAEVSQGTLQAVFEFQTMVCELFGLEVANASMYCGASASAEAVLMARRLTQRKKVVLSEGLHPEYIDTVRTFLSGVDEGASEITLVPLDANGVTDAAALAKAITSETAVVVLGYPNFLGVVESLEGARKLATDAGALLVTATWEPYALSLVRSPGSYGVDIAVGEGQALAISPQFGGPGVGLFACKRDHLRQMPGRLVGETTDANGNRGYVLTLSTREQHIRRERATSNICTNHGLVALAMAIRTAMLGKRGFRDVGELCVSKAEYLRGRIAKTPGWSVPHAGPSFNEFVIRSTKLSAKDVVAALSKQGILAGVDLGKGSPARKHDLLVAVTEKHTKADLDRLVDALATVGS